MPVLTFFTTLAAFASLTTLTAALPSLTLTPRQNTTQHTMGFIGCSMAENVAQGYVASSGTHMWGPYGTSGMVVQSWTDPNSASWQLFDKQVAQFGKPTEVWVQICIFQNPGATYEEVKQLITNARAHAAEGAKIWVTGQPLYPDNPGSCFLAGADGPQLTVDLAKQAGADGELGVVYPGDFVLKTGEVQDGCHANAQGQASLGKQAIAFWG
ncbi:uncharacterized protein C8A04DRAFT_13036 [Dichotomopilus funicola]|uniref:Uncharacterized protein n=1 Tax=Dichotomopilus funicola TaxID=1934379 RepID=A0AAN6ZKJ4_9PEZI|nr:hypothetical protein C8A04DRAFT_13036 [Dichotomopilus funicola]